MRRNRRNSAARNLNEKDPENFYDISLFLFLALSLSLSALPWVSINLLNFLKGKRRGNVARCVACARDRHFWIETRETFFIPPSPSFLRPRIYYPVNELRSSSFFWQKIHLYACEERKRAYIYMYVYEKKKTNERVLVTVIRSEFTRFIDHTDHCMSLETTHKRRYD